mgnify:CR=1 FL=1
MTLPPRVRRDFLLFLAAVSIAGFSQSVVDSVFNNFLAESFSITDLQRGVLEFPRELPGFLVVFVSALFAFLSLRRMASLANLLAAAGILAVGFLSIDFPFMLLWLFLFSTGQHLFMPLASSIGMEFAGEDDAGSRLGQFNGAMNFAAILGSFLVFMGFRYFDFSFTNAFTVAAAGYLAVSAILFFMRPDEPLPARTRFRLRKEYRLFYWLNILFGTRKQIFLTFAPWVLVKVFNQRTEVVATLLTAGGVIGIFFKPLLGRAIDRHGERSILMAEAALLVFVCAGYGFSLTLFDETVALYVAFSCYVIDQLLMSVSMARATYMRKIALTPADISQALTMGVSIDHVFSIGIALVSGAIWITLGYQYVFLLAAGIALANLYSASRIRIPANSR